MSKMLKPLIYEQSAGATVSDRHFIWSGLSIVAERDGPSSQNIIKRYTPQGEIHSGGVKYYYTFDHLGNMRGAVDESGTLVAGYSYDPFGLPNHSGSMKFDFLFTGHFYHEATGLYLAKYRAYDPKLGRWLSREPLGLDGPNPYHYGFNNPMNLWDPTGLESNILKKLKVKNQEWVFHLNEDPNRSSHQRMGGNHFETGKGSNKVRFWPESGLIQHGKGPMIPADNTFIKNWDNALDEAIKQLGKKSTKNAACWYVGKKGLKAIPFVGLVLGAAGSAEAYNNNGVRGVAENIVPYYQESVAGASYLSQKVINDTGSSYKNIPGFSGNHPANKVLGLMD